MEPTEVWAVILRGEVIGGYGAREDAEKHCRQLAKCYPDRESATYCRYVVPSQPAPPAAGEAELKRRIGALLANNGCDCECDHDSESHDDDCTRCLACLIGMELGPAEPMTPNVWCAPANAKSPALEGVSLATAEPTCAKCGERFKDGELRTGQRVGDDYQWRHDPRCPDQPTQSTAEPESELARARRHLGSYLLEDKAAQLVFEAILDHLESCRASFRREVAAVVGELAAKARGKVSGPAFAAMLELAEAAEKEAQSG